MDSNSHIKQSNTVIEASSYEAPVADIQQQKITLTKGHWLLIAFAAICISFITFLMLARSIELKAIVQEIGTAEPAINRNARIDIDALFKLPIANRILVLRGEHTITVDAEGYQQLVENIEVGKDKQQRFEFMLTPLPGSLDIALSPDVKASVWLNDEPAGSVPGLLQDIPAGEHTLVIDAPLYRASSRQITVEGKGITQPLNVSLEPAWAELSINSLPEKAIVQIDGERVGQTPLTVKVEEGLHTIMVQADKFKPFQQDITIVAQQDISVADIKLLPADGIYEINTEPQEAAVILNGEYMGISPISLNVFPDKAHQLQVFKAGYQTVNQEFTLAPAQRNQQQFELQKELLPVRFSISPQSAELFIDGESKGKGSQTITLDALPHEIMVKKQGYVDYTAKILPTKGNEQVVSVSLLTHEQHFWANVPDNYTSVAGHKMKLFKSPGLVKMGSSRREVGRRANEVAYEAKLTRHFYVSLHEVTNKQFRAFKATHNAGNYKLNSLDSGKRPAVNLSWQQAALYCNWLSSKEKLTPFYKTESGFVSGYNSKANGYRLLTEAEWSWLARDNKQLEQDVMTYPWGNDPEITGLKAMDNFADVNAKGLIGFVLESYDDGYKTSSPIGSFKANHKGIYDLGGNVSEWVNDWYDANADLASGGSQLKVDPLGPEEGEFHVVRGGSWAKGYLPQLRLAYRDYGAKGKHDVGFRVARYVR